LPTPFKNFPEANVNKVSTDGGVFAPACVQNNIVSPKNSLLCGWLCGTVVERQSLAGELSLSCARPAAKG